MITGKINLQLLKSVKRMEKNQKGEIIECLIIPIEANKLYKGEKGIYLDLVAFEKKERKEGERDTHLIKQSLSKEQREAMSEEELRAMPILGGLSVDSIPKEATPEHTETLPENSDLPF